MKRYFLLGLAALGLIALLPTGSKADDGLRVYVSPGYQQDGLATITRTAIAIIVNRRNIGGVGTIIGTVTVGI